MHLSLVTTMSHPSYQYVAQFLLHDCQVTIDGDFVTQLVIPSPLVEWLRLKLVHDTPLVVHPGQDRTLPATHRKFCWPTPRLDAEKFVAQCLSCAQVKGNTQTASILEYPLPDVPFDTVGTDLLQLPCSHQSSSYVLVCIEHFTHSVILIPLPNKSSTVVAHAIVSQLIYSYNTPHSFRQWLRVLKPNPCQHL